MRRQGPGAVKRPGEKFYHYPPGTPLEQKSLGPCEACSIPMLSKHVWDQFGKTKPEGYSRHDGHGYCQRCYVAFKRHGDPFIKAPRRTSVAPLERACVVCERMTASPAARRADPELMARTVAGSSGYCMRDYKSVFQGRRTREDQRAERDSYLEDWEMMRDSGETLKNATKRLDLTESAMYNMLRKARLRGDKRGSLVPFAHDMRQAS